MCLKPVLLILFLFLCRTSFAFQFPPGLSGNAQISLLTGTPGDELYSTFGHSAIRVRDAGLGMDIVFNYGTFNFNTPNFYWKFMRGQLLYMLSVEEFRQFKLGFVYEGRGLSEQVLNLDGPQKQAIYAALVKNYRPENRYYKYDFFYDNCATRIRDVFEQVLGKSLAFNYPERWTAGHETFRDLIDIYLVPHPWSDFGIDLLLGLPTDKVTRPEDYMFLPDFLSEAFGGAVISADGGQKSLVLTQTELVERTQGSARQSLISPITMCWGVLVIALALSLIGYKTGRKFRGFDMLLFSASGLLGWLIVFLWFFTDHKATVDNLNILWAVPLSFPLAFYLRKQNLPTFVKRYFWVILVLLLLLLLAWPFNPQRFHLAVLPILIALLFRTLFILFHRFLPWKANNSR